LRVGYFFGNEFGHCVRATPLGEPSEGCR
jgi:hypothetical protein